MSRKFTQKVVKQGGVTVNVEMNVTVVDDKEVAVNKDAAVNTGVTCPVGGTRDLSQAGAMDAEAHDMSHYFMKRCQWTACKSLCCSGKKRMQCHNAVNKEFKFPWRCQAHARSQYADEDWKKELCQCRMCD